MTDSSKNILGLLTIWPIVYIIIFMGSVFSAVAGGGPGVFESYFPVIMILHMLTMLLSLGLTVFYVVHAIRDPQLSSENRIIWVVVLLTTGLLGMPIYYWFRILGTESNYEAVRR